MSIEKLKLTKMKSKFVMIPIDDKKDIIYSSKNVITVFVFDEVNELSDDFGPDDLKHKLMTIEISPSLRLTLDNLGHKSAFLNNFMVVEMLSKTGLIGDVKSSLIFPLVNSRLSDLLHAIVIVQKHNLVDSLRKDVNRFVHGGKGVINVNTFAETADGLTTGIFIEQLLKIVSNLENRVQELENANVNNDVNEMSLF